MFPSSASAGVRKASPTPRDWIGRWTRAGARIRVPIMIVFTLAMLAGVGGVTLAHLSLERRQLETRLQEMVTSTRTLIRTEVSDLSEGLKLALDAIAANPELMSLFKQRDRDGLLAAALPLYQRMFADHRITHFYFTGPDRVNFLRVHKPDRYGDTVDRFTAVEAERSGNVVTGLEMGSLGIFTLRAVKPWYDGDTLIGFLEIGLETGHLIDWIEKSVDLAIIDAIHTDFLNREVWEDLKESLDLSGQWDVVPGHFVLGQAVQDFSPDLLASIFEQAMKAEREEEFSFRFKSQDRSFFGSIESLQDASGVRVGHRILIRDITADKMQFHWVVLVTTMSAVIGTVLIAIFLNQVLKRVEHKVVFHREGLEQAVEERTAELENEVIERTRAEAELRNFNANLEYMVRERTKDLERQVAERRAAQEALRENETLIHTIVDTAADAIITMGEDNRIRSFNRAAERIFGYLAEEAVGQDVGILMPIPEAAAHSKHVERYTHTGEAHIIGRSREVYARRKNGEAFPIAIAVSAIETRDGRVFTSIIHDISELKKTEQRLRDALDDLSQTQESLVRAEKLASLGELVAGVAHEINTPLGIGVTATSYLYEVASAAKQLYDQGNLKRSDLEELFKTVELSSTTMMTNLERAAELVSSFKQVAVDRTTENHRRFLLAEYLDEVLLSLHPKLKKTKHEVSVACDPSLEIECDPGAIAQIITNFVMNSLLHGFGPKDRGAILVQAAANDGTINLTYRDDGKGMPPDVLKRVFDPFFTTKRGQGGTGLGMQIVHNLVTQSLRGEITCISAPGEGTRFDIKFPRHGA